MHLIYNYISQGKMYLPYYILSWISIYGQNYLIDICK